MQQSGTLYIVATPIGNLDDASARMRTILATVDRIACEDTRHSGRLLAHMGLQKPLVSLHEHNEGGRIPGLLAALAAGENIALISDAGTPLLSDPGFPLVRAAIEAGLTVSPVPGPSAAIAALSVSGLPPEPFRFQGFPPRQASARRKLFQQLATASETLIFYESVHRLAASLKDMETSFGAGRSAFVGRELTKRYEQLRHGSLAELAAWASEAGEARKGEAVVIVGPAQAVSASAGPDAAVLLQVLAARLAPGEAAAIAAELTGEPKRVLYQQILAMKQE